MRDFDKEESTYNFYIDEIYNRIFAKVTDRKIDIFLCGGASSKKEKSTRDKVRGLLEADPSFFNILYPEDLFMEMLDAKRYDLFSMERVLADNVDVILIVPESPGSFAELGAFTNAPETVGKLWIMQHQRFKKQHSFITQGPVRFISQKYKGHVIYFNKNLEDSVSQLKKSLRLEFSMWNRSNHALFKDTNSLTGLVNFEILLLYFHGKIPVGTFNRVLTDVYNKSGKDTIADNQIDIEDVLKRASVKFLFKRGFIEKADSQYCLMKNGVNKALDILSRVNDAENDRSINDIRFKILEQQLYKGQYNE